MIYEQLAERDTSRAILFNYSLPAIITICACFSPYIHSIDNHIRAPQKPHDVYLHICICIATISDEIVCCVYISQLTNGGTVL